MNTSILPKLPVIKSVTDLRYKAREIVESVQVQGNTVLLTKDSDPVAVLFPIHLYETLRQYLENIEDMRDLADIKTALAREEEVVDFVAFDETMRKKHHRSSYVSRRRSK